MAVRFVFQGWRLNSGMIASPEQPLSGGCQVKKVILIVCLRFFVGATLLVAGIYKLPMHQGGLEYVIAYETLPVSLLKPYLAALPWLEVAVGACLILGCCVKLFSIFSIALVCTFIAGNAIVLSRGIYECGCFGGLITLDARGALLIDASLLASALLLLLTSKRFITFDFLLTDVFRLVRHKRPDVRLDSPVVLQRIRCNKREHICQSY